MTKTVVLVLLVVLPPHEEHPADAVDLTVADAVSDLLAGSTDTLSISLGEASEQGIVVGAEDSDSELVLQDAAGESSIRVDLPVLDGAEPRATEQGDVVFESANEGAEVLVQELDVTDEPLLQAAARAIFTIETSDVDPLFEFEFEVPGSAEIVESEDGALTVLDANGDMLLYVGAPWAVDATGIPVDTWYEVEDGKIFQYVDHLARLYEYPVIADPPFLVPVLVFGGRIVVQRVVAANAAAATRAAVTTVARTGVNVVGRAQLKSFTKSNYRHNLIVWTTRNPGTRCDAHHTLPQLFRQKFVNSGFTGNDSIDHPKYLVWWERGDHRSKAAAVNRSWSTWWGTRTSASKSSILTKRTAVLRQYPPRC